MAPLSLLIAVFVAMGCQDFLAAFYTAAVSKGRDKLAAIFDVTRDLALVLSLGSAADAMARHGLGSPYTLSILAAESVASFLSTMYATRLSRRLESRNP